MTLGTNNKKQVYILAALGLLAAYTVYTNVLAGPSVPEGASRQQPARSSAPAAAPSAIPAPTGPSGAPKRAGTSRNRSEEVHWVFMPRRPEDRPDPSTIDPTLMMDRLKRVQAVDLAGGSRNLFQFSAPPPPKPAELPKGKEPVVAVAKPAEAPKPAAPPKPVEAPPAPPPYKFYGYSTARVNGKKTAYFLDGEEIMLATEGDTLKRRYKVLRIGPTSVTIEDLDAKKQVSVPLADESQS